MKQDASTHAALEGCMGQHVQTQPNPVELHWQYAYGQIRVMDETCWRCAPLSYELGLLGGYYVIRRTDRRQYASKGDVVKQTPPAPKATAMDEWWKILHGVAI